VRATGWAKTGLSQTGWGRLKLGLWLVEKAGHLRLGQTGLAFFTGHGLATASLLLLGQLLQASTGNPVKGHRINRPPHAAVYTPVGTPAPPAQQPGRHTTRPCRVSPDVRAGFRPAVQQSSSAFNTVCVVRSTSTRSASKPTAISPPFPASSKRRAGAHVSCTSRSSVRLCPSSA
jgi:hypothetical protein